MQSVASDPVTRQIVVLRKRAGRPFQLQTTHVLFPWAKQAQPANVHPGRSFRKIVLLDGGEQLSGLHRTLLIRAARRKKIGLILTTHSRLSIVPLIAELHPDLDHFLAIARKLQQRADRPLSDAQLRSAYQQCGGDYRLSLRRLYDVYAGQLAERVDHSRSA